MPGIDVHAPINDLAKLLYLVVRLPVLLLHLLNYLQGPMLLAEHFLLFVFFVNFHAVVSPTSTLHMESNLAF